MSVYHSKPAEEDVSHQKISSHFLGPRAENYELFKSNIITILEEHQDSRLDYFPGDGVSIPMLYNFVHYLKLEIYLADNVMRYRNSSPREYRHHEPSEALRRSSPMRFGKQPI